ncbi:MAG: relaxase/mobilization nuclease domain-containing protein, partial [Rikenellaceae bacterium]|nr:relaxase/mobilization nuclease domain-containing protein [Rikenellaceae bacterium]
MAKIVKGGSFGGCVRYVTGKRDAKLLAAESVLLENRQSVIDSFEAQSQLNPRLGRKVGHISLNFSAQDKSKIDNAFMLKVAVEYMQKMGIVDTQFIVVRHNDREHP